MVIFHCYVSLPEGRLQDLQEVKLIITQSTKLNWWNSYINWLNLDDLDGELNYINYINKYWQVLSSFLLCRPWPSKLWSVLPYFCSGKIEGKVVDMKFMSRKNGKHDKNIVYTTWFICCATFYRCKISRLKWSSLSPKSRDTKPAQTGCRAKTKRLISTWTNNMVNSPKRIGLTSEKNEKYTTCNTRRVIWVCVKLGYPK